MNDLGNLHRDQTGMVGRFIIVWLLLVALFGLAAVDTASILFTRFRLSDIASNAASDAATAYVQQRNVQAACQTAADTVQAEDPQVGIARKNWCTVNAAGEFTIVLRKEASTIVASRLSFLKKYARVTQRETGGPATAL